MEAVRFIGKVLKDGHLSLPEHMAKKVGEQFEVVLVPLEERHGSAYAEGLARQKGFSELTEDDVARTIHESRGIH